MNNPPESVRVDKWLQVARMFKSRSQATRACTLHRVRVNGNSTKPHRLLQIGDTIEVEKGDWTRILVVKELADKPVAKALARELYEDQSPPPPPSDPIARAMRRPAVQREAGAGRPTKRERRQTDRLRGR
ncbi:MAG: S4 domain-containing protein [Acidobacteriota bacterium]